MKPDFLVGLAREAIRIAPDSARPPILTPVETYLLQRPEVVYDISRSEFNGAHIRDQIYDLDALTSQSSCRNITSRFSSPN